MYLSPSIAQEELRALARGKKSRLPLNVLAQYVLDYPTRDAAPTPEPGTPDDFCAFAERLIALKDVR
jgi:hypothetical protein